MTYTAALEALDQRKGRIHTVDDWNRVSHKARTAPATLTEDELVIIEGFGGEKAAADARGRRSAAVTPPAPTPPPRSTMTQAETKRVDVGVLVKAVCDYIAASDEDLEQAAEALERHFDRPSRLIAPMLLWMRESNARNVERNTRIKSLEQRVEELAARCAQLETRPQLKWCGGWKAGKQFLECSIVTHNGGLWTSERNTSERPGSENSGWRLIVRRGDYDNR